MKNKKKENGINPLPCAQLGYKIGCKFSRGTSFLFYFF
jgi:hypothetical protein